MTHSCSCTVSLLFISRLKELLIPFAASSDETSSSDSELGHNRPQGRVTQLLARPLGAGYPGPPRVIYDRKHPLYNLNHRRNRSYFPEERRRERPPRPLPNQAEVSVRGSMPRKKPYAQTAVSPLQYYRPGVLTPGFDCPIPPYSAIFPPILIQATSGTRIPEYLAPPPTVVFPPPVVVLLQLAPAPYPPGLPIIPHYCVGPSYYPEPSPTPAFQAAREIGVPLMINSPSNTRKEINHSCGGYLMAPHVNHPPPLNVITSHDTAVLGNGTTTTSWHEWPPQTPRGNGPVVPKLHSFLAVVDPHHPAKGSRSKWDLLDNPAAEGVLSRLTPTGRLVGVTKDDILSTAIHPPALQVIIHFPSVFDGSPFLQPLTIGPLRDARPVKLGHILQGLYTYLCGPDSVFNLEELGDLDAHVVEPIIKNWKQRCNFLYSAFDRASRGNGPKRIDLLDGESATRFVRMVLRESESREIAIVQLETAAGKAHPSLRRV